MDIFYFEVNNWIQGRDYPDEEPFLSWIGNDLKQHFKDDEWCRKNKLCVVFELIDMSLNFKVTATKEWIEKNCPCLFDNENKQFICEIDTNDYDEDDLEYYEEFRYGLGPFLKWTERNFGVHEYDSENGCWYKDQED